MHRRTFLKTGSIALSALAACRRTPVGLSSMGGWTAPTPLAAPFLFATGIENSTPTLPNGRRIDQMEKCGHYERWQDDFGLVREFGIPALRWGPAYYRTHPAPDRYDWSGVDDQMAWLREADITVIADLCHFGVPSWLDGFQDPAFPIHFADYAGAFARRYRWVRHFTPINEMFVAANFSAMLGWWNESRTGELSFARTLRNLCLAHELAVEAILAERPDAVIVQVESAARCEPVDRTDAAASRARFWNEARFAALDLTLGRAPSPAMLDLFVRAGMTTSDLAYFRERRATGQRWLGIDYYVTSEQVVAGDDRKSAAPHRVGLATLTETYHARYELPVFVTETSRVAGESVEWLGEQWHEVMLLQRRGVPVVGFTWFPLTDVIDWRHALRVERGDVDPIGLCDLARGVRPVGRAYAALVAKARTTPVAVAPVRERRTG